MDFKQWVRAQWDRVAAGVALVAGTVALFLGWAGVRDAVYPGQQIPYVVSGGMVALFLIGAGSVLWLSADLRDEWRKLDDIDEKLGQLLAQGGLVGSDGQDAQPEIDLLRHQIEMLERSEAVTEPEAEPQSNGGNRRRRPLQPSTSR